MDHTCEVFQSHTSGVLSYVNNILDLVNQLLSVLSEFKNIFDPTISSIISRNRDLKQLVRTTVILLQDNLLKTCESLANYGINEEMHREVRGDISRKEIQQLKRFLDTCTKRLNNTKDSYDKLYNVTKRLCVEIDKAQRECGEVKDGNERRGKREVTIGGVAIVAGLGALFSAFSPIAAPGIVIAALGAGEILAGVYHMRLPKLDDDKIKLIDDAHDELRKLKSILHETHTYANRCAHILVRSAEDLDVVGPGLQKGKTHDATEGSLMPVTIPECFGLDDDQLKKLVTLHPTELNVTLDEFETYMKSLLAGVTDARAKIEECIKNFHKPD